MKRYINGVLLALVIHSASYAAQFSYHTNSSDYSVVNDIKRTSNLTQNDVEKWKLVWLKSLQNIAATTVGGYAAYKAGQGAYQLAGMTMKQMNVAEGSGLLTHRWFWAVAGAAGAGTIAYKILYPRIERGILKQVNTYVEFCENLDVVKYWYSHQTLDSLGTSAGNAAWATTNDIARLKGAENLLAQAEYALGLLDQLNDKPAVRSLRARVAQIKQNLTNNLSILKEAAYYELQERSAHLESAQRHAQLRLTQEQTSALKVGKISLAATAMSNFVSNGLKTLVYINDNKGKIAGGAVIVGASAYGTYAYAKAKLGL